MNSYHIKLIHLFDYRQLYDYPPSQTFGAQTEFDEELFSNPRTGTSTCTDVSTQVDDKDVSQLKKNYFTWIPAVSAKYHNISQQFSHNSYFKIFLKLPRNFKNSILLRQSDKFRLMCYVLFKYSNKTHTLLKNQ